MKKLLIFILAALALSGCRPEPTMAMKAPLMSGGRITVEQIGIFKDELAYGDRRGVYIITDTKTGKEYIGVSGVGISETGNHQTGKTRTTDER